MTNPTHRNERSSDVPIDEMGTSWQLKLNNSIGTLAADAEQVYAGTKGGLIAVRSDGIKRWHLGGESSWVAPSISDGMIFVSDWGENSGLSAVNTQKGEKIWQYKTERPRSPQIVNNTVYSAGADSVFALDSKSGDERWSYDVTSDINPVVSGGHVFGGSADLKIYAISANNGKHLWTANIDSMPAGGGATVVDDTLYFTGYAGFGPERQTYAVAAETGEIEWVADGIGSQFAAPAVVDSVVYTSGRQLCALDADSGNLLWKYDDETRFDSSPLVVNGTVFVGGNDSHLHAVDASDGTVRWTIETAGPVKASPVAVDRTLYVAGGNHLYALGENE